MDPVYIPLLSALAGALIGSSATVAAMIIQNHYQTKREMQKLAIEIAIEEYRARVHGKFGEVEPTAGPILLAYYTKLIDLAINNDLTKEKMRFLFESQTELARAYSEAHSEFMEKPNKANSTDAKSRAAD
jgi:hypothetical protein